MSSYPNTPAALICTFSGKIIYTSRKAARRAAIRFKERKMRSHSRGREIKRKPLEAYHCQHCEGFHTGHLRGKRREKTKRVRPLWIH